MTDDMTPAERKIFAAGREAGRREAAEYVRRLAHECRFDAERERESGDCGNATLRDNILTSFLEGLADDIARDLPF